ncbi:MULTISPECIES: sigma factor-like helix-turn-helix DNA-binding protein [Sphingomonas]|jgi:DNA-directed RNA polymerase specialized sigma24 family protein|nr:sigma factor-like helix-turn-helix DNA-binding protein [Sphingomonas turrisvirgatae]
MNRDDIAARYRAAFQALPARTRTVFWLHCMLGRKISVVAQELTIPTVEVEDHLAAALVAIGSALDAQAVDAPVGE